jgi:hypothetical protein
MGTVHYPLKVLNKLISLLYNQTDQTSTANSVADPDP